jgi:hypothetical protein
MIKYFPVQNEDGAIEAWWFINTNNNSRIIITDDELRELSTILLKIVVAADYVDPTHAIQS